MLAIRVSSYPNFQERVCHSYCWSFQTTQGATHRRSASRTHVQDSGHWYHRQPRHWQSNQQSIRAWGSHPSPKDTPLVNRYQWYNCARVYVHRPLPYSPYRQAGSVVPHSGLPWRNLHHSPEDCSQSGRSPWYVHHRVARQATDE